MLVGESVELDALVPEELSKDEQGLVAVTAGEGERRGLQLRALTVGELVPDHAVALAVGAHAARVHPDVPAAVDHLSVFCRMRHVFQLHSGESALAGLDLDDSSAVKPLAHAGDFQLFATYACHMRYVSVPILPIPNHLMHGP